MCRAIINRKKEILLGALICYMVNVLFLDEDDVEHHLPLEQHAEIVKTHEPSAEPHPELNVTVEAQHPKIVIYNRVPKCGSQTMSMLINQLARKNGFLSQAVFVANEKPERSKSEQTAFMKELSDMAYSKQKHVLYTRHQYYISPDSFDFNAKERPMYINLIRDPIDRFKSFYYFSRYGNKRAQDAGRTKQQVPSELMNESIDDCIMRRRRECTEPIWHTVPYLCGNDKMCLKKFETTIQETKQAIDKNYLVLGVLEELKGFLAVLEHVLPDYFGGALEQLSMIKNDTFTVNKKELTPAAMEFLAEQTTLRLEYDLYNHIKMRLVEQMRRLGIKPESV